MWKLIIRFRSHIFSDVLSGQDGLLLDTHDISTEMVTFGKNIQGE